MRGMQTVFKHYHRQTAVNFKKERGRVPGMEGAFMKFTQICPIPEGFFASYDTDAGADESGDVDVVVLALTEKGEIVPIVFNPESGLVAAAEIPGFTGLGYEEPKEDESDEEQEKPPRKTDDQTALEDFMRERDQREEP